MQFHTRVAVNVLGIVERELTLGPELAPAERARAAALLGHDGDVDALERELAAAHPRRLARRPPRRSARRTCARPCGRSSWSRTRATSRRRVGVASVADADRDLERQLAEGPPPARRGVPRLRRRRRAVPPGDEARRQGVPRAHVLGARLRVGAPRPGPVERRRDPVARRHRRRHERLRRRARRSVRRRRPHPRRRRAAASASSACTCRTAARSAPSSTTASCAWLRRCTTGSPRTHTPDDPLVVLRRLQRRARPTATCGTRRSSSARPT